MKIKFLTRTLLAFLLASVFPSLFFIIAFQLSDKNVILITLLFSIPFSYLSCLIFGIPIMYFFKKRGCLNTVSISLSGALLGMLVFYLFGFVFSSTLGSSRILLPTLSELIGGSLLGLLVALTFCLIAGIPIRGNK